MLDLNGFTQLLPKTRITIKPDSVRILLNTYSFGRQLAEKLLDEESPEHIVFTFEYSESAQAVRIKKADHDAPGSFKVKRKENEAVWSSNLPTAIKQLGLVGTYEKHPDYEDIYVRSSIADDDEDSSEYGSKSYEQELLALEMSVIEEGDYVVWVTRPKDMPKAQYLVYGKVIRILAKPINDTQPTKADVKILSKEYRDTFKRSESTVNIESLILIKKGN